VLKPCLKGNAGARRADRGVDGSEQLCPARPQSLTGGIPAAILDHSCAPSSLGKLLCGGDKQPTDAVQHVALAAPMAEVPCRARTMDAPVAVQALDLG
jgi:hypothetical protein